MSFPEILVAFFQPFWRRAVAFLVSRLKTPEMLVVLTTDNARVPVRGTPESAGLDLQSAENTVVKPKSRASIRTDLSLVLPTGHCARICSRSGLSANSGVEVGAGLIDADYRGPLKIILYNHSNTPFIVNRGDRIAQLVCQTVAYPHITVAGANKAADLPSPLHARRSGGFGSTGVH